MFFLKKVLFSVAMCMGFYCCINSTTMAPKKANPILIPLNFLFGYDDEIYPNLLAREAIKKPLNKADQERIYVQGLLAIVNQLRGVLMRGEEENRASRVVQLCLPVVAYQITQQIFIEHSKLVGTPLGKALELLHYTVLYYWVPKKRAVQSHVNDAFALFCKADGIRKTPQEFEADRERLVGRAYLQHWLTTSNALRLWSIELLALERGGDARPGPATRRGCC